MHGVVLMGDDGGTTDFSSGSGGRGMIQLHSGLISIKVGSK